MKNLKAIFTLALLITTFLSSCTKENLRPENDNSSNHIAASGYLVNGEHPAPPSECSGRDTLSLVDSNGNPSNVAFAQPYGQVQVTNSEDSVYFFFHAGRDWYFTHMDFWYGENMNMPFDLNGDLDASQCQISEAIYPQPEMTCIVLDINSLPQNCNNYVVRTKVARLAGFFGGIDLNTETEVWIQQTQIGNGQSFYHCNTLCAGQDPRNANPAPTCEITAGAYRTQTQGGWGSKARGNNPGVYRNNHFANAFPNGITLGCPSGNSLTLTSSKAVENLLPAGGSPAPLTGNLTNPRKNQVRNNLASQLLAATLSTGFDAQDEDFGTAEADLAELKVNAGPFSGISVGQVISAANEVLGGCNTNYTCTALNQVLTQINENFADGTQDQGFLSCP